jgi:hypothetical protein
MNGTKVFLLSKKIKTILGLQLRGPQDAIFGKGNQIKEKGMHKTRRVLAKSMVVGWGHSPVVILFDINIAIRRGSRSHSVVSPPVRRRTPPPLRGPASSPPHLSVPISVPVPIAIPLSVALIPVGTSTRATRAFTFTRGTVIRGRAPIITPN